MEAVTKEPTMLLDRIIDKIVGIPRGFKKETDERKFKAALRKVKVTAFVEDGVIHIRPDDLNKFRVELAERGLMTDPFVNHVLKILTDKTEHIRFVRESN